MFLLPFHDDGRAAMPVAKRAASAVGERDVAVFDLDLGMGLAAQLAHGLDHLRHAAAVRGVVVAEPAAVGIERQLAGARNQVSVRNKLSAFALFAKAEV